MIDLKKSQNWKIQKLIIYFIQGESRYRKVYINTLIVFRINIKMVPVLKYISSSLTDQLGK